MVGRDLNSDISLNVENETTTFNSMKEFPTFNFCHCVDHLLEEIYVTRTSNDETFASEHDHLPQVFFDNLFYFELTWIIRINIISLSLSIKTVNFISCFAVKTFIRKVFDVALNNITMDFSNYFSCPNVDNQMVMCLC